MTVWQTLMAATVSAILSACAAHWLRLAPPRVVIDALRVSSPEGIGGDIYGPLD
jgi:hypothetical protein